jgi:ABC-type Fe3+-hydroxamate transport system substrate-binding protein
MRNNRLLPLLVIGAVATIVGCQSRSREEKPVETTSETTRKTDDTSSSSKTETTQLGENRESRTESRTDTPQGDTKTIKDEVVGTVTAYKAGERIEVMTGDKDKRAFNLDDKDVVINLDSHVKIGERVKVVEVRGDKGFHSITVTPAG